jgi:DNA polymerase II large subunit
MIILLDENFPLRFYARNREINDKIDLNNLQTSVMPRLGYDRNSKQHRYTQN